MGIVCLLLGLGLLYVAWRSRRADRLWFVACAVLNLGVAVHMMGSGYEYAWRLAPPEAPAEPGYRR